MLSASVRLVSVSERAFRFVSSVVRWNAPNRLVVGRNVKPGQKIHVVTGTVVDAYEIPPEERKPSDIELEESPEGEPPAEQQAPANAPTGEPVTQPTTGTTAQ